MSRTLIQLVILPFFCTFFCQAIAQTPLTVSVFYETLCPDSIRFITTQLFPTFQRIGGPANRHLNIDFVPYGKASTSMDGNGDYTFECQHGPAECEGNKMHACALKYLPENSRAAFINCSMSSRFPPSAGPACAQSLGLDFSRVDQCIQSKEAGALLAANGDRTHNLNPKLNFVPWILHNGEFSQQDLQDSLSNYQELLCRKLGAGGPQLCRTSPETITVSVFYETLCPDSVRFITRQLYPTFKEFGGHGNPYFHIDYVPYGKATTFEGPNGTFAFECQHGQRECEGNVVHSCALDILEGDEAEAFINCTMSSRNPQPPEAGPDCAQALELDYAPIHACFQSWRGAALLAGNGVRTHSLDPKLHFIPWIMYDGQFKEEDLQLSLLNFRSVICAKLGNNGPPICEDAVDYYNRRKKFFRRH